jgi:ankyrin repeat protein
MVALLHGPEELALLDHGADPKAEAPDGITVASLAEAMGSRRVLWRLAVASGAGTGAELLGIAARTGDESVVREALKSGVTPDSPDNGGWTPLLHATARGHHQAMRALLESGANPNAGASDGLAPMAAAILADDQEAISILLAAKANPNADVQGVPLLSFAVANGRKDAAEQLLPRARTRVRPIGKACGRQSSPKCFACRISSSASAEFPSAPSRPRPKRCSPRSSPAMPTGFSGCSLPACRPIPNSRTAGNRFMPQLRRQSNHRLAPPRGRSPGRLRHPRRRNPLIMALRIQADWKLKSAILHELAVQARSSEPEVFKATNHEGRTALMHVALAGHPEAIAYVMPAPESSDYREVIDQPDREGIRPLIDAVFTGDTTVVKILLDLGGAEKAPSDPASPQDIARQRRNWWMLDLLPEDRRLPIHIDKTREREERIKLQEAPWDWGFL